MAAETHYTANTGMVTISTANTNLDGSGTMGTVLTAASSGILIKNVFIKAVGTGSTSTSQGMVRLFVDDGGNNIRLLREVEIPEMGQSSTDPTFEAVIPLNYELKSGYILKASTENSESFNVIAEGLDYSYYTTSVREESTNYTSNTGSAAITTQNSNLDGSGTVATLVTAGSSGNYSGLAIESISLKAYTDVTRGMLRLFIQNSTGTGSSNTFLLTEIPVYPIAASAITPSFHHLVQFPGTLQIEAGFKIVGAIDTTSGEDISAITDAMDWTYPS